MYGTEDYITEKQTGRLAMRKFANTLIVQVEIERRYIEKGSHKLLKEELAFRDAMPSDFENYDKPASSIMLSEEK